MSSKCPQCFTRLDPTSHAWVCMSGGCPQEVDARASAYFGGAVRSGPVVVATQAEARARARAENRREVWPLPTPVCNGCQQKMQDACVQCHLVLPPNWENASVTCIAMSGARATGKSFHVAIGIKKLEELLLRHANTQIRPFSPEVERSFRENYLEPLYVERGVLKPTQVATQAQAYQRVPLVYDLGQIYGKRQFLVLRDVAGEEMFNLPAEPTHLEFVGRADAVFFLFDPLSIPEVRTSLRDVIPLPDAVGDDPVRVVNNMVALAKRAGGERSLPPFAVIMSKFDAVEELRGLQGRPEWSDLLSHRGAAFARDNSEASLDYDPVDAELLSAEVRSLILRLGGSGVVAMLENPSDGRAVDHQFFAISVLGHAPNTLRLDSRGIAPFRVLDPFKWALARGGVIRARSAQ